MRTGVFGGTFNPVHNGHVRLARSYIQALSLDRLIVMPAHIPPHKSDAGLAPGKDRLAMCRLAFEGVTDCEVSDLELRRGRKSYTVDTLTQLREQYPDDTFYLLMGSDMFLTLTDWRGWEKLRALAVMCAGAREPAAFPALAVQKARLEAQGARCEVIPLEPMELSSTMVRERAASGEDLSGLLPPAVAAYLEENRLYRNF